MYWAIEKSKQTSTQTHCNREPLHQQKTHISYHSRFPIWAQCFHWKSDTHVHSWSMLLLHVKFVAVSQWMLNSHWKKSPIFIIHLFIHRLLCFLCIGLQTIWASNLFHTKNFQLIQEFDSVFCIKQLDLHGFVFSFTIQILLGWCEIESSPSQA